jgi:Na+-transporting methylmalonyl-CoA/oxaloacetate decarboxylase beta subunit
MTSDNIERNDDFGKLMKKTSLEISDIDFEDKVMDKVFLASLKKKSEKKNIRLSWIFLIVSCILFPLAYITLGGINWENTIVIGEYISNLSKTISMAGIVIFCIVIFLQLDNLLRLTFRRKLV